MKYLIDTNIIIDALRHKQTALDLLEQAAQSYRPSVSYVTITEIVAGLHQKFKKQTMEFLNSFNQLEIDKEDSVLAGELIYKYARKGRALHFQDACIAASAINKQMILATANVKDFKFIEELSVWKY